jgi:hypothetical protein
VKRIPSDAAKNRAFCELRRLGGRNAFHNEDYAPRLEAGSPCPSSSATRASRIKIVSTTANAGLHPVKIGMDRQVLTELQ